MKEAALRSDFSPVPVTRTGKTNSDIASHSHKPCECPSPSSLRKRRLTCTLICTSALGFSIKGTLFQQRPFDPISRGAPRRTKKYTRPDFPQRNDFLRAMKKMTPPMRGGGEGREARRQHFESPSRFANARAVTKPGHAKIKFINHLRFVGAGSRFQSGLSRYADK